MNATATQSAPELTTAQEAYEIGIEAYIYFYPLVLMDLTRKQLTNAARAQPPRRLGVLSVARR